MLLRSLVNEIEIVPVKIPIENHRYRIPDANTRKENTVAIVGHGPFSKIHGPFSKIHGPYSKTYGTLRREAIQEELVKKVTLLKDLAGVRGVPLYFQTTCLERTIELMKLLESSFGAILLVGIAPEISQIIENRLKNELSIPIIQDVQDGTMIALLAGLVNALKFTSKSIEDTHVVVHGAGISRTSISNLLLRIGVKDVILSDTNMGNNGNFNNYDLEKSLLGADVFIGFTTESRLTAEMISSMNRDPVIFALAEPFPQILQEEAKAAGAKVVITKNETDPNCLQDALVLPGLLRGALDVQAMTINDKMRIAVAKALCGLVDNRDLGENMLPPIKDDQVVTAVASAVAQAAIETGVWTLIRGSDSLIC